MLYRLSHQGSPYAVNIRVHISFFFSQMKDINLLEEQAIGFYSKRNSNLNNLTSITKVEIVVKNCFI